MKIIDLNKRDRLVIKWRLTYACNYRCSYCIQSNKHNREMDYDIYETAKKINKLLEKSPFDKAEVQFIGGECSLLPLDKIIECIPNASSFALTTNFSAPIEFYNSLRNLDITCSYHYEYNNVEDFVNKFEKLNAVEKKIQVVLAENNKQDVARLVDKCEEKNIRLQVDEDRTKPLSEIPPLSYKEPRMKVEFDDGTEQYYLNKFEMLYDNRIPSNGKTFHTKGMLCSQGYDFIHIMGDNVWDCCGHYTLDNYEFHNNICRNGCSLCGRINLETIASNFSLSFPNFSLFGK